MKSEDLSDLVAEYGLKQNQQIASLINAIEDDEELDQFDEGEGDEDDGD